MRIAALNDSSASNTVRDAPIEISTKEAQEEAAFALYNRALQLQNEGDFEEAENVFNELLQVEILQEVPNWDEKKPGTSYPGLNLKYSTYKNLANIATKRGDYTTAMEAYLEAIDLDCSDVTLWFRMGVTALKIHNYTLGCLAFGEALKCNPKHWPSLDNIITILYTLNNYHTCLYYISRALQLDTDYVKGFAIRDQIFREHPGLRKDTLDYFTDCDADVFNMHYDKEEGCQHVEEALEMRRIKQEKSRPPAPPVLNFVKPLYTKTWKNLGECLLDLYDLVSKADKPISFSCKLNLSKYVSSKEQGKPSTEPGTCLKEAPVEPEVVVTPTSGAAEGQSIPDSALPEIATSTEVEETLSLSLGEPDKNAEPVHKSSNASRKRKRFPFEMIDAAAKRRSARVRNTATRSKQPQQEHVNFAQLLQKFLPSSLLTSAANDDCNDNSTTGKSIDEETLTSDDGHGDSIQETNVKENLKLLSDTEEEDVMKFLKLCIVNTGVLDVMYRYLIVLGERQNTVWPAGISDIYTEIYTRVREHITHPSVFCNDRANDEIKDEGLTTLCYCEFKMEKWMHSKLQIPVNVGQTGTPQNLRVPSPVQLGPDFPGRNFNVDVDFLVHLTVRQDIFDDIYLEFCVRVLWLRARYLLLQGQMDFAVDCFEKVATLMRAEIKIRNSTMSFNLLNCKLDNEITLEQIQKQLESLQQCQSLEELHRLHQNGEYQQVVNLLTPTFGQPRTTSKVAGSSSVPERHSQLLLLQDSLWNLGDQQQCLYWGEASINEALQQYEITSDGSTVRCDWTNTIVQSLAKLERSLSKDPGIIHTLTPAKLKRFIGNIIRVIVMQMETSETVSEMPIKTSVPWILLYYAIQQEEEKIRSLMLKRTPKEDGIPSSESEQQDSSSLNDFGPGMPSSLMLLYSAHEYLGRRGWCTCSEGALLLLYTRVLMKELKNSTENNPHPYKEDLEISVEQCFFCLYGHPNKKTKAKHLQEHGAPQIALTWEHAAPLFVYFKPKQLPEFDSLKAITVSTEVEHLLKRIVSLVPSSIDPASRIDQLSAYIEGSTEKLPSFDKDLSGGVITSELYYLLADYYFKNNEQGKAIKYYLLDVSVSPDRFDSWAGMALARSSQLEQKLNSCELKNDGPIYRRAIAAMRCFQHALELGPSAIALWIENGSFAYALHSYTCRQLKQKTQLELSSEFVQMLTSKRDETLATSQRCFKSANQCEESPEEEWLHHYMLGKIAEKMKRPPKEYLHHYKLAAMHLHLEAAWYPRKIQYHNPPNYSMEALEVYYRTHASILKYLLRNEGKPLTEETKELLEAYLKDAADGAFANFQEKRHGSQNASDIEDNALLLEECRKLRKVNPLANDHDYFKRKRKNSSTEEGSSALPRHRPSTDSSCESQDSATVKDILNSIVSVIAERMEEALGNEQKAGAIVMGDSKIFRPSALVSDKVVENAAENVVAVNPEKRDISEEEKHDPVAKGPGIFPGEEENAKSKQETIKKDVSSIDNNNDHRTLILRCEEALKQCLHRFPQHYKSLYRLAHYYFKSKFHKNIQRSLDYLLGPHLSWQQCNHMTSQALFAERKNTNFFNGIWRIPIDEIDRPGSFASHMFRSVVILMDILEESNDHNLMVHLAVQLHRNPDAGKKYLRDVDRMYLSKLTYDQSLGVLLQRMRDLCKEEFTQTSRAKAVQHLMDIYRAWQNFQKVVSDTQIINKLLEKAYVIFRRGKIQVTTPILDQAMRYCQQQQILTRTPQNPTSTHGDTVVFAASTTSHTTPKISTDRKSDLFANEFSSLSTKVVNTMGDGLHTSGTELVSKPVVHSPFTQTDGRPMRSILAPPYHALSSPNLLTAAVQSKIKSLDPVEPQVHAASQMSGFQLAFLRQIGAASVSMSKDCKTTVPEAKK